MTGPFERAREELAAGRSLAGAGFGTQAVAHAYTAGLQAARGALMALGELPPTPVAVVAAYGRLVVGDDGVPHETGRVLRRLLELRLLTDEALEDVPAERASEVLDDAERLLDATEDWLLRRSAALPAPAGRDAAASRSS